MSTTIGPYMFAHNHLAVSFKALDDVSGYVFHGKVHIRTHTYWLSFACFADFYAKETLTATVVQLPFTSVQSQISINFKIIAVI
jgi:hypothetical protein